VTGLDQPIKHRTAGRRAATHSLRDGLIAAALLGLCMGTLDALTATHFSWRTAAVTVATATLGSVVAYVRANYVTPYLSIRRSLKENR
jgi:hypothetical protein